MAPVSITAKRWPANNTTDISMKPTAFYSWMNLSDVIMTPFTYAIISASRSRGAMSVFACDFFGDQETIQLLLFEY